jgi:hypothetical protein
LSQDFAVDNVALTSAECALPTTASK